MFFFDLGSTLKLKLFFSWLRVFLFSSEVASWLQVFLFSSGVASDIQGVKCSSSDMGKGYI
jgi:hypothetical protein